MATQVPTTIDVVLLAVQAQLASTLGWPLERVLIDADSDTETNESHEQADQYLRLRWQDGQVDGNCFQAAGRVNTLDKVEVTVELWTRLALDTVNEATAWVTDPSLGHARARHAVYAALAEFLPEDADENTLLCAPIEPRTGRAPKRKRAGDGWGASTVVFSVLYQMDLPPIN